MVDDDDDNDDDGYGGGDDDGDDGDQNQVWCNSSCLLLCCLLTPYHLGPGDVCPEESVGRCHGQPADAHQEQLHARRA